MTDHNVSQFNFRLYQTMLTMFPTATPDMVWTVITKYNGNIQRCVEDLASNTNSTISGSSSSSSSDHVNAVAPGPNFPLPRNRFPPDINQRQYYQGAGARSHSVSGVPSGDSRNNYAFGYPGSNHQGLAVYPQTAPILSCPNHPFGGVGFQFPPNNSSPNLRDVGTRPALMPITETPKRAPLPKPPVPPPTYRFYQQQQINQPGHGQGASGTNARADQQHSLYPRLPNDSFNNFAMPTPRHMTSLSIVPVNPQFSGVNYNVPHSDTSPPSYGWATKTAMHSTSINFQLGGTPVNSKPPELHITTTSAENTNCTGSRGNGYGGLSPVGQTSGGNNAPYQSKVQISISPTGSHFSTVRGPLGCNSSARFSQQSPTPSTVERRSPVGVGYNVRFPSPTSSSQSTSPLPNLQIPPSGCQDENSYCATQAIFDHTEPELERLAHVPLKPLPAPQSIKANIPNWNAEQEWSVDPRTAGSFTPQHELYTGEAYLRGLIENQRQKFNVLSMELEKEKLQLETIRKEVANTEKYYFSCQVHCQDSLFFSYEELEILRAEVRSLMVDCECMTRMVDLLHKGQVPLGETNEDFYKSINTGQQGPVLLISKANPALPPVLTFQASGQEQSVLSRSFRPLPPQPPSTPPQQQRRLSSPTLSVARPPSLSRPSPLQDDDDDEDQKWACCTCTFRNAAAMEMCEMCEMPKFIQATSVNNQSGTLPFNN